MQYGYTYWKFVDGVIPSYEKVNSFYTSNAGRTILDCASETSFV